MKQSIRQKLNRSGRINALTAVLLVILLALVVVLLIPVVRDWLGDGSSRGCNLAVHRTTDQLRYEAASFTAMDVELAEDIIRKHGSFCPGGGDFYVVEDSSVDIGVRVVCGLHDPDTLERTELNAKNALSQVRAALSEARRLEEPVPSTVPIRLNSADLTAEQISGPVDLHHGTYVTPDLEGIVIWYVLDENDALTWFCYADPDHCARWRSDWGWLTEEQE